MQVRVAKQLESPGRNKLEGRGSNKNLKVRVAENLENHGIKQNLEVGAAKYIRRSRTGILKPKNENPKCKTWNRNLESKT